MAVIEQRYAQALAELVANGVIPADTLGRELAELTATVRASAALRTVLASPAVRWEDKVALLDRLAAAAGFSRLTRNFMVVATQRGRITHLDGIEQEFEQILLRQLGIVRAEVTSARPLSPEESAGIERHLAERLGKKLQTTFLTDPALLGGFIARVGDQVYDGSIGGRLQRLQHALMSA